MKPGLLPLMLLRVNYATSAWRAPVRPDGKTITKLGPTSITVTVPRSVRT